MRSPLIALSLCGYSLLVAIPVHAALLLDEAGTFSVYGDARLRTEKDWDSYRGDGSQRDDRTRTRIRARLGATWKPMDFLEFGVRARTGN